MLVIYKDFYGYKVADEKNYNKQYANASSFINCKAFDSASAIIEYFSKYCNKQKEDFIIIDE